MIAGPHRASRATDALDTDRGRGPRKFARASCAALLGLAIVLAASSDVAAHPHVWVTVKSRIVYTPGGMAKEIRHAWSFDDMFSAFATQGIATKKAGVFTRQELSPLAEVNVTSLKEYQYFTYAKVDGKHVSFSEPVDYWLDFADGILTLNFTLPFRTPAKAAALSIEVFDPNVFVYFAFDKKDPVTLAGGPASCKVIVQRARNLDAAEAQSFGEAFFSSLARSANAGAQFANKMSVQCP